MFNKVLHCATLLICINANSSFADEDDPTIVTLPYGKIQGHILKSTNNNNYYAFQEIPYASPPVGELRFKESVPPEKWEGTLEVTKNTKICYQFGQGSSNPDLIQTEDCLYLNVYTPQIPNDSSKSSLPVLVWIHGGGFLIWDGTFQSVGPQFYMDYNIIVVAINYRLGPLGFLTTEDRVIPGNLALKDQRLALQWIKENINLFGGDPEKITIAGESAGALSVGFHVISKQSKGLFRAAILQSGTPIVPNIIQPSVRKMAFEFGRKLDPDFDSEDSNDLLELLQKVPAADIASVILPSAAWAPVIEDKELEGAFITGPMHEDIKNGNVNRVPILLGYNSEEVLGVVANDVAALSVPAAAADKDVRTLLNGIFNIADENQYAAGNELRKIYTDGNFVDDIAAYAKYMSDTSFSTPTTRQAELESAYTDVYLYQFSYKGVLGRLNVNTGGVDISGVGHTEDLRYMWADSENSDINSFPIDDILTHIRVLRLWSNFVKYLNPTPSEDDLLGRVIWPKVSPDSLSYLNINTTLEVQTDPKEYKKWKQIIDAYAIPPFISY